MIQAVPACEGVEGHDVTEGTTEKSAGMDRVEHHSALQQDSAPGVKILRRCWAKGGFGITYLCRCLRFIATVADQGIPAGQPRGSAWDVSGCVRARPKCPRISYRGGAASSARRGSLASSVIACGRAGLRFPRGAWRPCPHGAPRRRNARPASWCVGTPSAKPSLDRILPLAARRA